MAKHWTPETLEGSLVKGNRNAIYLVKNYTRFTFPDFYTFDTMGYNVTDIHKIPDDILHAIPLGEKIKAIAPPPVFRTDDFMYHTQCEDPDRMINELGVIPNMGDFHRSMELVSRIKKKKSLEILALGGSITAGGYFLEFVRSLKELDQYNVTVHNHGHGATEITYTIFCVDIDRYLPDLVLIDFSVNDNGHPKLMDALIRKVYIMKSSPVIILMNLWASSNCQTTRYLTHSIYYHIPIISLCTAVNLCFGKSRLPKYISDQYSTTDGVHPWGTKGVKFISDLIYAWWKRISLLHDELLELNENNGPMNMTTMDATHRMGFTLNGYNQSTELAIPPPLYTSNPIGLCTRCDALADDADAILTPVGTPKGFRVVTRMKIGFGGFNPSDKSGATKSFKRSWQADKPGSEMSFKFYGSSVKIAIWQRRDSMGVLHAYVDGDRSHVAKASGFFKGYTWAMERNNTGRSEIIPLFEGLEDITHTLTLIVSEEPANPWVKGHTCQVFALLSASNRLDCKNIQIG